MHRAFVSWGPPKLKSLQHIYFLSPCYLLPPHPPPPHTYHNLTVMDYLPYSKHYYANKVLMCLSLCLQCHFPNLRAAGQAPWILSPQPKYAFLYENFPMEYNYYFHCCPHSSLLHNSHLFCNSLSPYHIRLSTTRD